MQIRRVQFQLYFFSPLRWFWFWFQFWKSVLVLIWSSYQLESELTIDHWLTINSGPCHVFKNVMVLISHIKIELRIWFWIQFFRKSISVLVMVPIWKSVPVLIQFFLTKTAVFTHQSMYTSMLGGFWLFRVTFDFSFESTINNDFGSRGLLRTNLFINWSRIQKRLLYKIQ